MKYVKSKIVLLIFLLLCFSIYAEDDYVLGIDDVIEVNLYGQPDFSGKYVVRNNGKIKLPLINYVDAEGLTISEVEKAITKLLAADYFVDPHVNITVSEYNSKSVVILGQVQNPGEFPLKKPTTLLKLISIAGGLTENNIQKAIILRKLKKNHPEISVPDTDMIKIVKDQLGTDSNALNKQGDKNILTPIVVNLESIFHKGDFKKNLLLKNDDVVYIPEADYFFIFGEVNKPGSYKVEDDLTVLKAVSIAGGFTPAARKNSIRITRGQEIIKADDKTKVQPQDVITILQTWF